MKCLNSNNIKRLLDMQYVRVYTYQHPDILSQLNHLGFISGNKKYQCDFNRTAYDWMYNQLKCRLKNFTGDYPVWAWPKRLNTRIISKKERPVVRITAIVPSERILISDFYSWHTVLNDQFLANTEIEFLLSQSISIEEKIKSWDRIFDFIVLTKEECAWRGFNRTLQYCVDRIYEAEVFQIRLFE